MVFRRDKKIIIFLGLLLVFLCSCGGGGSDSPAPVNKMPQGQKTVDLIVGKDSKILATWSQAGVREPHGHFSEDIFGAFIR